MHLMFVTVNFLPLLRKRLLDSSQKDLISDYKFEAILVAGKITVTVTGGGLVGAEREGTGVMKFCGEVLRLKIHLII